MDVRIVRSRVLEGTKTVEGGRESGNKRTRSSSAERKSSKGVGEREREIVPVEEREGRMEKLNGLLRVRVIRGVDLAVRDMISSDPYVIVRMGKQVHFFPPHYFVNFAFMVMELAELNFFVFDVVLLFGYPSSRTIASSVHDFVLELVCNLTFSSIFSI